MEEENKEVENVVVENEVSSTETPAAEVNPVETPKSADDTNGNPLNVKPETGMVGESKKDILSEKTDLEKAQYSFHKQLSKQKAKYEQQIAEAQKRYEDIASRLEKLENPDKYREKYRDDFKTDDEYINHLVQQKFESQWKQTLEEYEKQEKEKQEQEEIINTYKSRADESVKKFFPTEEAQKDYHEKVQEALDKGLGDVIDEDEDLAQYIMMSPNGAKIMYELATNIDAVKDLFENTSKWDKQFKIRALEQKLMTAPTPVQPTVATPNITSPEVEKKEVVKKETKPIGRPGTGESHSLNDVFSNDDAILSYLRKH